MSTLTATIGDQSVELQTEDGLIYVPVVLLDSPRLDEMKDNLREFLSLLPAEATSVPWVIGSTDRNVMGEPRKAASHANNLAYDASPMYSETELISPDRDFMGMAWKIPSLLLLSDARAHSTAWVVEGDHVHFLLDKPGYKDGEPILAVTSVSSWYPITDRLSSISGVSAKLFSKAFTFDPESMTFKVLDDKTMSLFSRVALGQ